MNNTAVTVVDAVMGTGKSTWAIHQIVHSDKRYIVVLPYNDEISRYATDIEKAMEHSEESLNVVALDKTNNGQSKTHTFIEALKYADCIIITHKLFEEHLDETTLRYIKDGQWHLIIDETLSIFEEQHGLDVQDIECFQKDDIATVERINDKVSSLVPNLDKYEWYMKQDRKDMRKAIIRNLRYKELLIIDTDDKQKDYYMYSLSPRLIEVFQSLTLLTYLFKDSEMDLWFRANGYEVQHMELIRDGKGHTLREHTGHYSGKGFADMITVLEPTGRGKQYGDDRCDLSNNQMKRLTNDSLELKHIKNTLRNLKRKYNFENSDFMFTCRKDVVDRGLLIDRKLNLSSRYVGKDNFLAFSARGINGWDDRHFIYYGVNVFQFPRVTLTFKALGWDYNEDHLALSMMLQYIWRSAIRRPGEKITIMIQSKRMRELFLTWLYG